METSGDKKIKSFRDLLVWQKAHGLLLYFEEKAHFLTNDFTQLRCEGLVIRDEGIKWRKGGEWYHSASEAQDE